MKTRRFADDAPSAFAQSLVHRGGTCPRIHTVQRRPRLLNAGRTRDFANGSRTALVADEISFKGERFIMLKKSAILAGGLLLLSLSLSGDQWNKKTVLTFSESVEIPGVVLPAGQYVFKLLDSLSDRHIVQVFNADENKVYATILAIPHYRMTDRKSTR